MLFRSIILCFPVTISVYDMATMSNSNECVCSGSKALKWVRSVGCGTQYYYSYLNIGEWSGLNSMSVGNTYNFQAKINVPASSKISRSYASTQMWVGIQDRIDGNSTERWDVDYLDTLEKGKWSKYNATHKINSDATSAYARIWFQGDYATYVDTIFYVDELMLCQKPFCPPFTLSARGSSSLTYNLNSSLGLDWSGDWTICYWKIPIGTTYDTMTSYNIESLGCNSSA